MRAPTRNWEQNENYWAAEENENNEAFQTGTIALTMGMKRISVFFLCEPSAIKKKTCLV